jgi:erythromycin esterase-like protein
MVDAGYVSIGGLAREKYGDDQVSLVGFGSYHGTVLAGSAWGSEEQVMPLPPAPRDSYEYAFHQVAMDLKARSFYVDFPKDSPASLFETRGHRAVGVVYNPRHESRGNYVPTRLAERYDAFVFVDKTQALTSLHNRPARHQIPETWPSGQ